MSTRTIPEILDEIEREIDECDQAGFFARMESLLAEIRHIVETAPIQRPYVGLRWRLIFDGHEDDMLGGATAEPDECPECGLKDGSHRYQCERGASTEPTEAS